MSLVTKAAIRNFVEQLRADTGLRFAVADLASRTSATVPLVETSNITAINVSVDAIEHTGWTSYPRVHVYCEQVRNQQLEKGRAFSGTIGLVAEVRVSHDRLESVNDQMLLYADAVTDVLDGICGDWGEGLVYGGGYEIQFSPVRKGGKNFVQSAKVSFQVSASIG